MKACQNCAYRGKYRGSSLVSRSKRLYPCAFWSYGVTIGFSCSCWKPMGQGAVQLELFEFESDASDKARANTELMRWIQLRLRIREGIDLRKEGMMKIKREKEQEEPQFSIDNRGFNVKAWYLKDTEESQGDALIEVCYGGEVIREFLFPSYKIYNIAAHFGDIVDGELSKDDKERGYRIAASTGLEDVVVIEKSKGQ